jgi:hypothetical protein
LRLQPTDHGSNTAPEPNSKPMNEDHGRKNRLSSPETPIAQRSRKGRGFRSVPHVQNETDRMFGRPTVP